MKNYISEARRALNSWAESTLPSGKLWSKDIVPYAGEFVLAGTLALGTFTYTACGGSSNGGPPPPPPPPQDKTATITVNLKDADAKGACTDAMKNVAFDIIYVSDGNKAYPVATDTSCKASKTITLLKTSSNDKFKFNLQSGSLYNYREDFTVPTSATSNSVTKDVYNFERFTDPLNAGSTDYRNDLLEWLKWMTARDGSALDPSGKPITATWRWRDQDIPIAYFMDNPGSLEQPTLDAEADLEAKTGLDLYRRVDANPAIGVRILYGSFSISQTVFEDHKLDSNGIPLYPLKVRIEMDNDEGSTLEVYRRKIEHEGIHALTFVKHSPFSNHLMFGQPFGNQGSNIELSDFEARTIIVLHGLPNNTDMARYSK